MDDGEEEVSSIALPTGDDKGTTYAQEYHQAEYFPHLFLSQVPFI